MYKATPLAAPVAPRAGSCAIWISRRWTLVPGLSNFVSRPALQRMVCGAVSCAPPGCGLRFTNTSSISSRSFPGGWQGASSKVQTRAMRAVCGFGAPALACRAAAASLGAFARYQCSQDAREHTRDRRGFEFGVCQLKLRKPRQAAYGATRPEHHVCPVRSRNLPQSSMKPIRGGRGSGWVSTRGRRPSQCRFPQRAAQPTRGKT